MPFCLEGKGRRCLADNIVQCRLPGNKVCNFTMNLSSGYPQPIFSNVAFGPKATLKNIGWHTSPKPLLTQIFCNWEKSSKTYKKNINKWFGQKIKIFYWRIQEIGHFFGFLAHFGSFLMFWAVFFSFLGGFINFLVIGHHRGDHE